MRNKRLDILRGVAVLLVLVYHGTLQNSFTRAGWVGVDLFFVLSGFLISGLLFAEYKQTGSIDIKRFFIRRALKLYPAFYIFLLLTLVAESLFHHVRPLRTYLSEALYVQNYGPALWPHTWSLAVEEQFYISLPIFLLLLMRVSSDIHDPFGAIPKIFPGLALMCIGFRFLAVMRIPAEGLNDWDTVKPAAALTHERIDALFFGVLLGYLYHFREPFLAGVLRLVGNRIILGMGSALFLSSAIFLAGDRRFMLIFGYTFMYLAFGTVLLLSLRARTVLPKVIGKPAHIVGSCVAYIGMYSYSIYLWHLAVLRWEPIFIEKVFQVHPGRIASYASYLILSVAFGILMSRLIEYPVLAIRDRWVPYLGSARGKVTLLDRPRETQLVFNFN